MGKKMRNGFKGFDDGAFFFLSGSFYFLSGRACSLLASAVAFRFRPAGGRLWDCDGFASLLGKAGRGIACSVLCINKRLERRCFDVHPFTSGFLEGVAARHTEFWINTSQLTKVCVGVGELICKQIWRSIQPTTSKPPTLGSTAKTTMRCERQDFIDQPVHNSTYLHAEVPLRIQSPRRFACKTLRCKHKAIFIHWLPTLIPQTLESHSSLLIEYRTSPSSIPAGGVS